MKKVVFIGGSLDGKSAQVPALAPTYRAVRSGPQAVSYLTSDKTEPIGGKIEYDEYRLEIIAVSSNWKFYLYVLDGISMKNVLERILDAYHACEAAAGERDAAKAEASHYRDRWSDSVIMHTDAVTELADLRSRLEALANGWDSERAEWVKNGVLNYSIALERAARELRALLRKEAK